MSLPVLPVNLATDCWNRIGVRGDHSCPELSKFVHCHNCPVFANAGRRILDSPSPAGYVQEWTERLAAPVEKDTTDLQSVLIFRLGQEWLALSVRALVEVTNPGRIHRVPHREGLLAGIVNIRGELHLCVHLAQLLGIRNLNSESTTREAANGKKSREPQAPTSESGQQRFIVARRDGAAWVFPVDQVDQVHRFPSADLTGTPATLARAAGRLTQGVFAWNERSIGFLDDAKLFQTLRTRIR